MTQPNPDPFAQFKGPNSLSHLDKLEFLDQKEGDDVNRMDVACGCVVALVCSVFGFLFGLLGREIIGFLWSLL
jgi:hypothetical protein